MSRLLVTFRRKIDVLANSDTDGRCRQYRTKETTSPRTAGARYHTAPTLMSLQAGGIDAHLRVAHQTFFKLMASFSS